jgi:predicted component of type VI protein secretion system
MTRFTYRAKNLVEIAEFFETRVKSLRSQLNLQANPRSKISIELAASMRAYQEAAEVLRTTVLKED